MPIRYYLSLFILLIIIFYPGLVYLEPSPIKIFIVNSYHYDHFCTKPQIEGFKNYLSKYGQDYNFIIQSFYMETNIKNNSIPNKRYIGNLIIDKINKFNPDYIYLTDDNAFEYIGTKLSDKYKIITSGINKPFNSYLVNFADIKKENIIIIQELISLEKLNKLFDQLFFKPEKVYMLTEPNGSKSETSFYMEENYTEQFKKYNFSIIKLSIDNLDTLKYILSNINKDNSVNLIVLPIQRIFSNSHHRYLNKDEFIKFILAYNSRQLELGGNTLYSELGIGVCTSPSFEFMGELSAKTILDDVLHSNFNHTVILPPNDIYVNKKRLDELGLIYFYQKKPNLIDGVFDVY